MDTTPNTESARFPWLLALLAYGVSYGVYFFVLDAVYWDDWTLVAVPGEAIRETFRQAGSVFNVTGHLHSTLQAIGVWSYRPLVLLLTFSTGVCVWGILKSVPWGASVGRSVVAILFLILPLNSARIALIMMPVAVYSALFFLAWYLVVSRASRWTQVLAFVAFFFSFNLNSLLVFYLLPGAHIAALALWRDVDSPGRRLSRVALFALCPVLFSVVKWLWYLPSGAYAGQHELDFEYLRQSAPWVLVGLVYAVAVSLAAVRIRAQRLTALIVVPVGLWVLWLGMLPYAAVGKGLWGATTLLEFYDYAFFDWNMRFQALLPLGAAILIGALDRLVRIGRVSWLATAVTAAAVTFNVHLGLEYRLDWAKQQEVIALWAASPELRDARTIVISDPSGDYNARRRSFRHYEYTGWLYRAFGDQRRFAMDAPVWRWPHDEVIPQIFWGEFTAQNHARDYKPGAVDVVVELHAQQPKPEALWSARPGMTMTVQKRVP